MKPTIFQDKDELLTYVEKLHFISELSVPNPFHLFVEHKWSLNHLSRLGLKTGGLGSDTLVCPESDLASVRETRPVYHHQHHHHLSLVCAIKFVVMLILIYRPRTEPVLRALLWSQIETQIGPVNNWLNHRPSCTSFLFIYTFVTRKNYLLLLVFHQILHETM